MKLLENTIRFLQTPIYVIDAGRALFFFSQKRQEMKIKKKSQIIATVNIVAKFIYLERDPL